MATFDAKWEPLRAEWRIGMLSTRALARRYGVHEATIRGRVRKNPGLWVRDPHARDRVLADAQRRTIEGGLQREGHPRTPHPPRTFSLTREGAGGAGEITACIDQARAEISCTAEAATAELIARTNLDHLALAQQLTELLHENLALLRMVLQVPHDTARASSDGGNDSPAAQAAARQVLFRSRRDSLAGYLRVACQLAEAIQRMERRALGIDKAPKEAEPSSHSDALPPANPLNETSLDLSKFTSEEQAQIEEATRIYRESVELVS